MYRKLLIISMLLTLKNFCSDSHKYPILFFNPELIKDPVKGSREWNDLQKKMMDKNKCLQNRGGNYSEKERAFFDKIYENQKKVEVLFKEKAKKIAQSMGAYVLLNRDDNSTILVTNSCDITNQIIEQINNEYVPQGDSYSNLEESIYDAVISNAADEITKIVKAGANPNLFINGKSLLFWAISFNCKNAFENLLKLGANPSHEELDLCIKDKNTYCAILLMKKMGIDLNKSFDFKDCNGKINKHPIYYMAMKNCDFESIMLLIRSGISIKPEQLMPEYNISFIEWLVKYRAGYLVPAFEYLQYISLNGYDINKLWEYDEIYSNPDSVSTLIKLGANIDHTFNDNIMGSQITPIFKCIRRSDIRIFKPLLNANPNINQKALIKDQSLKSDVQHTPLSYATSLKRNEIVQLLIDRNASY